MVLVDDFSRFTWVEFLREKSDTFGSFSALILRLQNEKATKVGKVYRIRSDHGREFENVVFAEFCNQIGILHEFSAPKTPQQNGIVERKNRTLQEMARVMIHARSIPMKFWAKAVNTACYTCNRVFFRPGTTQTAYELWKGRTPKVSHFRIFGCICYVLNDRDHLGKFDKRSDEALFLGYSRNSRAYRVFNKRTRTVLESVNVKFDDAEFVEQTGVEDDSITAPLVLREQPSHASGNDTSPSPSASSSSSGSSEDCENEDHQHAVTPRKFRS